MQINKTITKHVHLPLFLLLHLKNITKTTTAAIPNNTKVTVRPITRFLLFDGSVEQKQVNQKNWDIDNEYAPPPHEVICGTSIRHATSNYLGC